MSSIIIGISGKKQSGKSFLCDEISKRYGSWIETANHPVTIISYSIVSYSFADMLKQKVCIDTMGLTDEQCNGTDEQKNTITMYKWENLPEEIRLDRKGFMTGREIMQVVGTDIFRKYFDDDIWVNATLRVIDKERPVMAIISDVRFPGEVQSIINNGGYVIRLLRDVCEKDSHSSEIALDDYDFSALGKSCFVLDNSDMSIEEKNEAVFSHLDTNWEIKEKCQ